MNLSEILTAMRALGFTKLNCNGRELSASLDRVERLQGLNAFPTGTARRVFLENVQRDSENVPFMLEV